MYNNKNHYTHSIFYPRLVVKFGVWGNLEETLRKPLLAEETKCIHQLGIYMKSVQHINMAYNQHILLWSANEAGETGETQQPLRKPWGNYAKCSESEETRCIHQLDIYMKSVQHINRPYNQCILLWRANEAEETEETRETLRKPWGNYSQWPVSEETKCVHQLDIYMNSLQHSNMLYS
jgi:hypothetical protein